MNTVDISKGVGGFKYYNHCILDVVGNRLSGKGFEEQNQEKEYAQGYLNLLKVDGGKATVILREYVGNSSLHNFLPIDNPALYNEIKILAPFNYGTWYTLEVNIKRLNANRGGRTLECVTQIHHPLGHYVVLNDGNHDEVRNKLERDIKDAINSTFTCPVYDIEFKYERSRYSNQRRQNDGTSCGPIVAEEIIQLATTDKIEIRSYSAGASEIRIPQLKALIERDSIGFHHVMDYVIKNQREFFSEEEIAEINAKVDAMEHSHDEFFNQALHLRQEFTDAFKQKARNDERYNIVQSSTPSHGAVSQFGVSCLVLSVLLVVVAVPALIISLKEGEYQLSAVFGIVIFAAFVLGVFPTKEAVINTKLDSHDIDAGISTYQPKV